MCCLNKIRSVKMTAIPAMDLELKRVSLIKRRRKRSYHVIPFQAFTEMQVTKIETTKKLKMLDLQMDVLKTSKKKYAITSMEVTELTPDARCVIFLLYTTRMFCYFLNYLAFTKLHIHTNRVQFPKVSNSKFSVDFPGFHFLI